MTYVSGPVPPIAAHSLLLFLLQVALLLLLALLLGRFAVRLGLPAVVGELTAGVLLGPSVLGHLAPAVTDWLFTTDADQFHLVDAVAQLGVLLLVGLTGCQLDLRVIRRSGAATARVSAAGLIVPLGLGVGAGVLLAGPLMAPGSNPMVFASFLGVAMSVSAIPVISKILMDLNLMHRRIGQTTLAVGMVDDVIGWILLSVVSAMATTGLRTSSVLWPLAHLVVLLAFALVIARPTMRLVLRSVPAARMVPTVVVLVLAGAALTQAMGLEAVFGAFLIGIVVGSTPGFDPGELAPLRGFVMSVLAPIFFATAGLRMDLTLLANPTVLLAALAVLLIAVVGKFTGAYVGALASRLSRWEALALGAGMNARGVIEVVVATVGIRLGVINTAGYTAIVFVAIVTSLMAPPILRYAMSRVALSEDERTAEPEPEPEPEPERAPDRSLFTVATRSRLSDV